MSDAGRDRLAALRSDGLGALLGASLAALALALREAFALADDGLRVCIATAVAALVLTTAGALLALAMVALMRAALAALARLGVAWSLVLSAMLGASGAVLYAQGLVLRVLSGQGIRAAVVALSGAVGVAIAVTLLLIVRALWTRHSGWSVPPALRAGIGLLALGALLLLVVALSPGFADELDIPGLWSLALPVIGGVVGAALGAHGRVATRAAVGIWLTLSALSLVHFAMPARAGLGFLVQRDTHATRMVFDLLQGSRDMKLPAMRHSGTCHPGVAPGPIRGVHRASADAPDIVLITVDALRWDHTSLSGYARNTTPNLLARAKSAAVFASAFSPASSTRQTFRALFSGLLPSQIPPSRGGTWWVASFAPKQRTLAGYLKDAGYLTVSVSGGNEGFRHKEGALQGFTKQQRIKRSNASGASRAARVRGQLNAVLEALRDKREAPRFVWTHLMATHQPYSVDQRSPYGKEQIDRYDGAINFIDRELALVFDALEKEGRLEHTYVILSADHGQAFGEHGNSAHGYTVYQEETHVPFVVWGLGIAPGVRTAPISTLDMFPTIIDLAGLDKVAHTCGESLLPTLRDATVLSGRDVYMEQIPDGRPYFALGMVRGSHQITLSPTRGTRELFDLKADPKAQLDLSEEQPALMKKLIQALIELQRARGLDPASYGL